MASVVELTAQLDALRLARASGVLTVRSADSKTVTFKSDSEMAAAIADISAQITVLSGVPLTAIRIISSKGLD